MWRYCWKRQRLHPIDVKCAEETLECPRGYPRVPCYYTFRFFTLPHSDVTPRRIEGKRAAPCVPAVHAVDRQLPCGGGSLYGGGKAHRTENAHRSCQCSRQSQIPLFEKDYTGCFSPLFFHNRHPFCDAILCADNVRYLDGSAYFKASLRIAAPVTSDPYSAMTEFFDSFVI